MLKNKGLIRTLCISSGILSIIIFILAFVFFESVRSRMVAYSEITLLEENLFTGVGFGLLFILCFFFLSLWQTIRYLRFVDKIAFSYVLLLVAGVLAFLCVFSDLALLHDIVKQYQFGLSQPEWSLLYPIMGAQTIVAIVFLGVHITRTFVKEQLTQIARDSNIFVVVQYIGIICGVLGVASNSLGFFFPHGWTLTTHSIMSSLILISPYVMAIVYWFLIKIHEKEKELYDEKQKLDVGKAAFLAMIVSSIVMVVLFAVNFQDLDGVISILWLPLLIFIEVFLFSLGNVFFSHRS